MMDIFQRIVNFIFRINSVFAQNSVQNLPSFTIINPIEMEGGIDGVLNAAINLLLTIGIPLAVLMYLWAGFQFLTSAGEEKKIKSAKQTLTWTTVGVIVILTASGIEFIIRDLLMPQA